MTDKRLVTDAEADEISEVSDGFGVRALLDTRERCIEVLETLAAPSRSFGYDQDAGCQRRMSIAASLLRELHGEGETE